MTVTGVCKGEDVAVTTSFPVDILGVPFAEVTAEHLVDLRLDTSFLPEGCSPQDPSAQVILNTVTNFTNTGTSIQADVVGLFVITK